MGGGTEVSYSERVAVNKVENIIWRSLWKSRSQTKDYNVHVHRKQRWSLRQAFVTLFTSCTALSVYDVHVCMIWQIMKTRSIRDRTLAEI